MGIPDFGISLKRPVGKQCHGIELMALLPCSKYNGNLMMTEIYEPLIKLMM